MPPGAPPPQAVILAGGLGTRMRPRTDATPKLLLPVAGRPFGAWLLERIAACGFGEALLCVGHLGAAIRAAFGGRFAGLALRYADDGPVLLGTAGALRGALPHLAPAFLLTYGDSYLPFDYLAPLRDLEAHPEALGTMAVYRNQDRHDASNTAISGESVVRYEKRSVSDPLDPTSTFGAPGRLTAPSAPNPALDHIDYGATALRREAVEALPAGVPLGFDAVQRDLAARGLLRAYVARARFYEIGSEAGLCDLEAHLAGGAP